MKKFEKYIRNRFRDLARKIRAYDKTREAEILHDVRVTIKRLKAVIFLIGQHNGKFKGHKEFTPLREIFREAVDIRQPEVMFQLLLKYHIKDIPRDSFLDPDRNAIEEFTSHIPGFIETCKSSEDRLLRAARKIDHKDIINTVEKTEKRLKKALTSRIKFELIHKTRKVMKQLIYLSEIHGDLKKKKRIFFDSLQELIGSVHDKQMLMIVLKKPATAKHRKLLKDLSSALENDKRSISEMCNAFYKTSTIVIE
jgi:CHAD domain-containing protein